MIRSRSVFLVCFAGSISLMGVSAFASCPDLGGTYSCGAFKISIQQTRANDIDSFTIVQYQQDADKPFETGSYVADGKTYTVGSGDVATDGTVTASCQGDVLVILEHASYLPYSTEKHFVREADQLMMQDGSNQNGQFHSDDKHKIFCTHQN